MTLAVMVPATFDPLVLGILCGVFVAALGIGPLASWAFQQPRVVRMAVATAIAVAIGSVMLLADPSIRATLQNPYPIDCDHWFNWPLCWAIWG